MAGSQVTMIGILFGVLNAELQGNSPTELALFVHMQSTKPSEAKF